MHHLFCIDLDRMPIEITEFYGEELSEDLKVSGLSNPMDLADYDRKLFGTESEAEAYLSKYLNVLRRLDNKAICNSRELPCMLYKRRYIIQTLFGEKNQTYRHYRKDWKPGQLFNLHDQTYFLTVRLLEITEEYDEDDCEFSYCYKFELP